MKRIGTTTDGGAIVAFDRSEVAVISQAMDLLNQITAEVPAGDLIPKAGGAGGGGSAPAPLARGGAKGKGNKAAPAGAKTKVCTACEEELPLSDFYPKNGKCKRCYLARQTKKVGPVKSAKPSAKPAAAPKPEPKDGAKTKVCTACDSRKPISEFYAGQAKCKPCLLAYQKRMKDAKRLVEKTQAERAVSRPGVRPHAGGGDDFKGLGAPVVSGQKQRVGMDS